MTLELESAMTDMEREETGSWGAGGINSESSGKWQSEGRLEGLARILERWKDGWVERDAAC